MTLVLLLEPTLQRTVCNSTCTFSPSSVSPPVSQHGICLLCQEALGISSACVAEVLEEILQQDGMRRMNFADLSGLLETCDLECPDRTCAISLLQTIRNILLPDTLKPVPDTYDNCIISQSTAAPHQGDAAMKYAKVSMCCANVRCW